MSGTAAAAIGEIIRSQRQLSQLPMRQLADMVGISHPYLSQIERGLRAPSERVLEAIAICLRTTTEALYAAAGIDLPDFDVDKSATLAAISNDPLLTGQQARALTELYRAFIEDKTLRQPRRRRLLGSRRLAPSPPPEVSSLAAHRASS